jgi:hypothetical protein
LGWDWGPSYQVKVLDLRAMVEDQDFDVPCMFVDANAQELADEILDTDYNIQDGQLYNRQTPIRVTIVDLDQRPQAIFQFPST